MLSALEYFLFLLWCVFLIAGERLNVAQNKPAWMSTTRESSLTASQAVDGITTADKHKFSAHTKESESMAWWKVDLQMEVQLPLVKIFFRTDHKVRRNGVRLYTSMTNPSHPKGGTLCYNVTGRPDGTDIPDVLNVTCPGTWRYLTVYTVTSNDKEGPVLDFVEVQVWACGNGTYGDGCNKACANRHCKRANDTCYHVTGNCSEGCESGWRRNDCSLACENGSYGYACNKSCVNRHCMTPNDTCDHVTGLCSKGCESGWNGTDCLHVCGNGTYGEGCNKACATRHCKIPSDTCNDVTGNCPDGCKSGWYENDCSQVCGNGTYGDGCKMACATRHCKRANNTCDPVTGNCSEGCESGWNGKDCSLDGTSGSSSAPGFLMLVIVGGATGLLVATTVFFIVIACGRKANNSLDNEGDIQIAEHQPPSVQGIPAEAENRDDPEEGAVADDVSCVLYANADTSKILVRELAATIAILEERKDGFQKEYGLLPAGFTAPYEDSQKAENSGKNKFREYYPYDHNRVRLTPLPNIPGSDYINASLMHSFNLRRNYIAAQAPNKKTVGDFWRMIWERSCSQIVMLTGLVEERKVKCEQYWPSRGVLNTDLFRVEVEVTQSRANFTLRHMKVTSCKTEESRSVVQFHFTSWPDHGVPDTLALVNYIWLVRETVAETDGPLLVHCSAGIGRTGTYIAVDSLIDQALVEGVVDVLGYVTAMRGQRKNMIQTPEQYRCVFHCLLEMTKYGNTSLNVDSFTNSYSNSGMDTTVDERTFRQMSEMLTNEPNDDSPSRHRMWVDGNPDFIVRVGPSLTCASGYLQAVAPPAALVKLLWKLVEENNVHNIIVVTPLEVDVAGVENEKRKYDGITITATNQTNLSSGLTLVNLKLETKNTDISRAVKMLHIPGPITLEDLGTLILGNSHLHHMSCQPHPTVVLHREVDRKTAVSLCIMGNILCGILDDHRVDVVGHVRTFVKCCPGFHITQDDVRLLYDFCRRCGLMEEKASNYANL
ncbi:receptor-type tyrosine-protein phosphatase gamma-like isoform X2 [Haliotis rufescens]|uniref:receptor-type tyrosine-protein phosphatase gamma-like isoform X2 n=1 Tax=Haliotis rufescens TaxID=6454 RepID=UPI00201EB44A|nr:receptor-type tyrosine-protein phosphatase gamma-like isoform X2 [Haliotis rufescens]